MAAEVPVVEGVAQLVGQGNHVPHLAVKIGQDAAFADGIHPGAEGAAGLAVSGEEIDPAALEGLGDHLGFVAVKPGEQVHQIVPGLLGGKGPGGLAHGGKEVVPGKTVFVAQKLTLDLQVLPELGQVFVHGFQHGIQGLPAQVRPLQGHGQGGVVAPELGHGDGFQLQGIEGEGHRVLDGLVAAKLCLIGIFSDFGIGGIGQIPDGGQVGGSVTVLHGHGAGQVLVQLRPGIGPGELGHHFFPDAGKLVDTVFMDTAKQIPVFLQQGTGLLQLLQVLQAPDPLTDGSKRGSGLGIQGQNPTKGGHGLIVPGVGRLPQFCVGSQLLQKLGKALFQPQGLLQGLLPVLPGKPGGKGYKALGAVLCRRQIGGKFRGIKAGINGI